MKVAIVLNTPSLNIPIIEDYVIFTDGGYQYKNKTLGKVCLGVVGDFDTLQNIPIDEKLIKLEKEKNFTDGERAVYYAKECGATDVTIYGATHGKLEHVLGNLALLSIANTLNITAKIVDDDAIVYLRSGNVSLSTKKGTTISVIPYTNEALVSDSFNLYYPFENLLLTKNDTHGISNIATDNNFGINVIKGQVLVIIRSK